MASKIKKILILLLTVFTITSFPNLTVSAEDDIEWNVMDKQFTDYENWRVSSNNNAYENVITQHADYINIKTEREITEETQSDSKYYFLVSPANLEFPVDDDIIVEFELRIESSLPYEGNEISVRAAGETNNEGRIAKALFYNETEDEPAHVLLVSTEGSHKIYVDVTAWNTYRFVISEREANGDRTYDFYVNGNLEYSGLNMGTMKGADLIRIGHDNSRSSDLSIRSIRVKASIDPHMTNVEPQKKYVSMHKSNELDISIYSMIVPDNSEYKLELLDNEENVITDFDEVIFNSTGDISTETICVPENLESGMYKIRATYGVQTLDSEYFYVINEEKTPYFPHFEYVDEPVKREDHIYNSELNPGTTPSEWNFPSIVD
ncbi:MAG: hypothetical protein ACK5G7_01370, partial [Erysipelotrichaceae bacterium]